MTTPSFVATPSALNLMGRLKAWKDSRLYGLLRPFKKELWLLVAISSVANLLMLLPTVYMLQIFDRVMISKNLLTLLIVSLIVLLLYALQAFSEWLRTRVIVAMGIRMDMAINGPLFYSVFRDRLAASSRNPTQALSDLTMIRQWMTGSGLYAFLDAPWSPFYIAIMFLLHPFLGWITIIFIFILLVFSLYSIKMTKTAGDATIQEEQELNEFIFHKLRNAELIAAQGMVPNFQKRWWARQVELAKLQHRAGDLEERFLATGKQLKMGMNSLAIGAGALLAIEGEITMGAMIAAGLLMARATAPVDNLVFGWKGLLMARSAFGRLEALLLGNGVGSGSVNGRSSVSGLGHTGLISGQNGGLTPKHFGFEFQDLSVELGDPPKTVLRQVTLTIRAGVCTVVLGRSGAGKSTLARLLVGITSPSKGQITMGGVAMAHLNRASLGSKLGYLPQEVELFSETVAQNIARLSEPDAEQVIAAARSVGIHEFILSLPKGYDTFVGETGGMLSGGQRQRIALARAVYGDPQLIVLDEPNANLDEAGEKALHQVIQQRKAHGATIVIVSHRPAAIDLADDIIELRDGDLWFAGAKQTYVSNVK